MKVEEAPVLGFVYVSARGGEMGSAKSTVLVAIRVELLQGLSVPSDANFGAQWVDDGQQ